MQVHLYVEPAVAILVCASQTGELISMYDQCK
jgi:hypothetical protein